MRKLVDVFTRKNMTLLFFLVVISLCIVIGMEQPNILFILVDDVGFNDVGYMMNSDIETPFINELIKTKSLKLTSNYVTKLCSPSRASLLSGRYPIRYGIQYDVLDPNVPISLSRQNSLLSNEFQNQGYSTHMIGYIFMKYIIIILLSLYYYLVNGI